MALSQEILQQVLSQPFKYFDRVDSTNDIAKNWLHESGPEGAVVIADEQLQGRGRKGRSWQTPPHAALALSIILRPPAEYLPRINMIGALSVYDLARHAGCRQVGIKWPNDVQVKGMKICGILAESVWDGDLPAGVVLGIGVNVRIDFSGTLLQESAISLEYALQTRLDRAALIAFLLRRIDYWYGQIATDDVFSNWRARLNMLKRDVVAEGLMGTALDALEDGSLLLRDSSGQIHRLYAGDILVRERSEGS